MGTIRELNGFLGTCRDDTFMHDVIQNTKFSNMKKNHETAGKDAGSDVTTFQENGVLPIYRKGWFQYKKFHTRKNNLHTCTSVYIFY